MKKTIVLGIIMLSSLALAACENSASSQAESSSSSVSQVINKDRASAIKPVNESESNNSEQSASTKQVNERKNSNSEQSASTKQVKEPKNNNSKHALDSLSPQKLAEFNKKLTAGLAEDRGFALGGNKSYNWATYIDSVSYSSRGLIAKVTSDFTKLSKADKQLIGNRIQGLAGAEAVLMHIENAADLPAIYTNIHYNGRRIGHSKLFHVSEFTWSK